MPILVNAAKTSVPLIQQGAGKTDVDAVKVNADKAFSYLKSSPELLVIELGVGTGWAETYRETGPISGGDNRDVLAYAGVGGWNGENENGLMGIHNLAAVVAALNAKPNVVGDAAVFCWTGFKRSAAAGTMWFGWHDQIAMPGSLPARFTPETDLTYNTPIAWTRPGAAGESNSAVVPEARAQNIIDKIRDGTFGGSWFSADAGDINDNWGWFMGSSRSTSNSSGISGGITAMNPGDTQVARLEVTIDL